MCKHSEHPYGRTLPHFPKHWYFWPVAQALSVVQRLHPTLLASAQRFSVALNAMAIPVDEVRRFCTGFFQCFPMFFRSLWVPWKALKTPNLHTQIRRFLMFFFSGKKLTLKAAVGRFFLAGLCSDCTICRDLSSTEDSFRGDLIGSDSICWESEGNFHSFTCETTVSPSIFVPTGVDWVGGCWVVGLQILVATWQTEKTLESIQLVTPLHGLIWYTDTDYKLDLPPARDVSRMCSLLLVTIASGEWIQRYGTDTKNTLLKWKKGPLVLYGMGMKSYPIIWGWNNKPLFLDPVFNQPVFHGK